MPYLRPRTRIAQRRERAILLSVEYEDNGGGGQHAAGPPQEVGRIWVQMLPLDERTHESIEGAQLTARHGYHFDTRYRTDVTPQQQLVWRGKTLEIQTVVDDEGLRRRLVIFALEVQ